jgi:NAD(P)-dependent dehydrogenase (short-subunit alcohol dehydrogenase family)
LAQLPTVMNVSKIGHVLNGVVVITGGGSGIGLAAALACGHRGARVVVLDTNAPAAEAAAAKVREGAGVEAIGLWCDVRDEESVARAVTSARLLGPVQGLVTSAGIDRGGLAHELDLDRWRSVIDTNLTGTFLACKHVLIAMLAQGVGGSIVCVSSPWADVAAPGGVSAYCASKGGVGSLVRSLALDYAAKSIRVNAIVPGATETPLMWANVPSADISGVRERIAGQLALRRLAEPDEIAAGVTWLLSEQASYVTGTQLVIDGGLLARASIEG